MDLAHVEPVVTFLAWAVQVIKYTGAVLFLLFIGWCGLTGAFSFTCYILKHMLSYAWQRTLQARAAFHDVRAEIATFRFPLPPLVNDPQAAYGAPEPTTTNRDRDTA